MTCGAKPRRATRSEAVTRCRWGRFQRFHPPADYNVCWKSPWRSALTIVELLVAIAIIGFLVAILFPGVQAAREAARRVHCINNLRQLGVALHGYDSANGHLPAGVVDVDKNFRDAQHSGFALLLPFFEEQNLYDSIDFDMAWQHGSNRKIAATRLAVLMCPSSESEVPQSGGISGGATDYAFSKGPLAYLCQRPAGGGMFDINSAVRFTDMLDGASKTFALGEAASSSHLAAVAPCG